MMAEAQFPNKGHNFMIQFSSSENQLHHDALEANSNIIEYGNTNNTPMPLATIPQESSINHSKDDLSFDESKGPNPFRKNQISQITEQTQQTAQSQMQMQTQVSLTKLDRFSAMWMNFMLKASQPLDFILVVIEQLQYLFRSQNITFFVLDKRL